jgi:hypothetical protein
MSKFIQDATAIQVDLRALLGELVYTGLVAYGLYQAFMRLTH